MRKETIRGGAAVTTDFWANLDAVSGPEHWKMHGTGGNAKGQPTQTNSISHGSTWPVASLTGLQDSLYAAGWLVAPPFGALDPALLLRRSPTVQAACYRASWSLPEPDFHRPVFTSFRVLTFWSSLLSR